MSVTLVVILNEVNLSQVYLWLQEKSLFSMGALLYNPSPGEALSAGDMGNNHVLSVLKITSLNLECLATEIYLPHKISCGACQHGS